MARQKLPTDPIRTSVRTLLAAGAVTLALLSAACNDAATGIVSPARQLSASVQPSIGTSNFTVLANAAVTCTNGSITGSVGTFVTPPTGAVTQTSCPISGSIVIGNAAAKTAYKAFVAQYNSLAPAPGFCTTSNTLTGTLAGVSLPAGTYCVSAEAKTGVLTLTGSGPWTFLVLGALTGNNFSVVMADGGDPCNVTWWVQAAATMTTSGFQGNILAGAAITITGGPINGNLYAGAVGVGDVTVTGAAVTGCAGVSGGNPKAKCNQGVGNGFEGCDPGNSNNTNGSNDENGGTPGNPGRKGTKP
jgi:hypothetical protein